ncbi:MAG TPA: hypothetical protein PKG54_08345 [Phycisphaerae bacterium]|jgi:hypothetical protein|nr:hypothetical protein [Phycisphaerae bacterium]HOB74522.1 hypothetical protein [Phycisphaerae bacterium]HOJ54208.1 hypothetical protein [Phycisphaerae bacterium]HOL26601.1 hypothetical protein [Phycisphaerae bacterium]HPP20335.1 hypothetical protein [Phycisphaerae bacterium]
MSPNAATVLRPGKESSPGSAPTETGVRLRRWTYPYAAALAICSDLDETPDRHVYLRIARFLNTTVTGEMGPGVGLEVGNSIYFDMPPDQFAYWTTDDAGRAMIHALIRSGHIDVLHSYGDYCGHRDQVARHLDELRRHELHLEVWVDHSKAPTNFGPDIMCGRGDVPSAPMYHADLTLNYGIRYVWRGRTTVVTGQDAPASPAALANIWTWRHPLVSAQTAAKEAVKVHLGKCGHPRWEMYADNRTYRQSTLRDGQGIWEFLRSSPFWGGSGRGDTADGIPGVLTEKMLRTLIRRQGACILYTHLGKVSDPGRPFGPEAQAAFRRLARFHHDGRILIRTTQRLLKYLVIREHLCFAAACDRGIMRVTIEVVADPVFGTWIPSAGDLQGLTFEMPRCEGVQVYSPRGEAVAVEVMHEGQLTRATIPWRPLEFPEERW